MDRQRAQSETLGFVLVFALIVASIGVVYAAGFSGLQDVRDAEQVTNAERAFEVMADNIEDVTQHGAPSRATEIKLADAGLFLDDHTEVWVHVPDGNFNATYRVRPIVYDSGSGPLLVYEQGAIFRTDGGGSSILHESGLLLDENRTVIPVIQTRLAGNADVSGSATVLVRTRHSQTTIEYLNDTTNDVWLNVTSPRADAWRYHLDQQTGVDCDVSMDDTTSCLVTTDSVYVTVVRIDVAFE